MIRVMGSSVMVGAEYLGWLNAVRYLTDNEAVVQGGSAELELVGQTSIKDQLAEP
jgi:hypothetical protein